MQSELKPPLDANLPLAKLRIVDFSRLVPGPYCTLLLGRLGAQVVRVEDTQAGDPLRRLPPLVEGVGATFRALNAGKESVALDLKTAAGQKVARELAARADVVVEGFRPGVAERLGIDFPTLSGANPRLVYCAISGYGQKGPWRDLPGHDLTYMAMSGLLDALTPDEPRVLGVQLADAGAAFVAAIRILAALLGRDTARGPQLLDVSLHEGSAALMPIPLAEASYLAGSSLLVSLRGSARNNVYRCADGRWIAVSPMEDHFWERFSDVLRGEGMIPPDESPTFDRLRVVFAQRPADEWFDLLAAAGIPSAPVRHLDEAAAEIAADALAVSPHLPPPPGLGEHTMAHLEALGYARDDIDRLAAEGVVRVPAYT